MEFIAFLGGDRMYHFFAYLSRMKLIKRWSLMRNSTEENLQEHSMQVVMIAHALAEIQNRFFGGKVNAARIAMLAMYHDAGEVIVGDLPTPVKYFNPEIHASYSKIEDIAKEKLLSYLPPELQEDYRSLLFVPQGEEALYIKAADKICAYLKCLEEMGSGNREFSKAGESILQELQKYSLPAIGYFLEHFAPSFSLTLDELN